MGIKVSKLKILLELLLEISVMFSQMLVYHKPGNLLMRKKFATSDEFSHPRKIFMCIHFI